MGEFRRVPFGKGRWTSKPLSSAETDGIRGPFMVEMWNEAEPDPVAMVRRRGNGWVPSSGRPSRRSGTRTVKKGARGSVWGTFIGRFLIGVINNGMNLLGISTCFQLVLKGLIGNTEKYCLTHRFLHGNVAAIDTENVVISWI